MKAADYSWGRPGAAALAAAGFSAALRYLSYEPGKNISAGELAELHAASLDVALVWETTADRALAGHTAGVADAQEARAQASAVGYVGAIYFAVDFDASEAQQAAINAYFTGVGEAIPHTAVGVYGGYYVVKRVFDAGLATYGWQTLAWSGGQKDPRIHLYQNGQTVLNGSVDVNDVLSSDFGQHMSSAGPNPPAPLPDDTVAPALPVVGHTWGNPTQWYDWTSLAPVNAPKVPAGVEVKWTEARRQNGVWWDRIANADGSPGSWCMTDADVDDGGFEPPHFRPAPAPAPVPTTPGPVTPPPHVDPPVPVYVPPAEVPPVTPDPPVVVVPPPVAPPPAVPPVVVPQVPWYRNMVVWSTLAVHAVALFWLIEPLVHTIPGVPSWALQVVSLTAMVLNQLGYQNHSAVVRTAEIGGSNDRTTSTP